MRNVSDFPGGAPSPGGLGGWKPPKEILYVRRYIENKFLYINFELLINTYLLFLLNTSNT